jgi:homoserine dehydrogenase
MSANSSQPIRVALAGCGTVGTGVLRILVQRGDELYARSGLRFEVAAILERDPTRPRGVAVPHARFVRAPDELDELLVDGSVDVLVEVLGGTDAARHVALAALEKGLPVVTANKALIAIHGRELFDVARRHGTCVAFEASCAGGVPVVAAIQRGLIATRINAVYGIVNGTCNYVLTEMLEKNRSYAEALGEAQRLGYAEADPTLDVDGTDSAHKLAILALLALGADLDVGAIDVEGIQSIHQADLAIARTLGYACKLLAIGLRTDAGLSLRVHPALVPLDHPLARTRGVTAAAVFLGDAMDQLVLSGSGAGSLPTAGAVVSDLVEVACGNARRDFERLPIFREPNRAPPFVPAGDMEYRYYLRCFVDREPNAAAITNILASARVDVDTRTRPDADSVVLITRRVREDDLRAAVAEVRKLVPEPPPVVLRFVEPNGE